MEALVLEEKGRLSLRNVELKERLGPRDVRIELKHVGICGSDIHYYTHGGIGRRVVTAPMILGHEAAGVILEVGPEVTTLAPGDRVCMEPGIPNPNSRASREGIYNVDPDVTFWATPPVHGVMRPLVIHPADFCFRLPDHVSTAEGAMVEPLAVGLHAAAKASITPGDVALVIGAGTIGLVTALSALSGGCSRVIVSDVVPARLEVARALGAVTPVDVAMQDLSAIVAGATGGWGADLVFEASGSPVVAPTLFDQVRPGGTVVYIGMPGAPVSIDVGAAQRKEATIKPTYRYAHVFERAVRLIASGRMNVKPLITETYNFADSIRAFEYAASPDPSSIKVQVAL